MEELFGLADCNNFYASCERVFRPDLRNRPIVVLSNNDGCVVARSNETKKLGIGMGVPFYQIKELVRKHDIAVFSSNYTLYGDMSRRVMSLLAQSVPHIDVYSIDECFLDFSQFNDKEELLKYAHSIVRKIYKGVGIPLSLGIAPTKTLAKVASRFAKKYPGYKGVCMIDTEEKRIKALELLEVGEVWGVGRKMKKRLEYFGVKTALDFAQRTESWIRREFTVTGVRTWKELNGISCINIEDLPMKKSICTSRSFAGEGVSEHAELEEAVANFAAACAEKLRRQGACCSQITVFAHTSRFRTDVIADVIQQNMSLEVATQSTQEIVGAALEGLRRNYKRGEIYYKKAGVIVWGIVPENEVQGALFDRIDREKQKRLTKIMDKINAENGRSVVKLAVQGVEPEEMIQREHLSRRWTTELKETIVLKV